MIKTALQSLLSKCRTVVDSLDPIIQPIAAKTYEKLWKYESVLCCDISQVLQIMDPRFGNDLISHSTVLRHYLVLPSDETHTSRVPPDGGDRKHSDCVYFMVKLFEEDSLQDPFEDEVVAFLRATGKGDKCAAPFDWWRTEKIVTQHFPAFPRPTCCSDIFCFKWTSLLNQ